MIVVDASVLVTALADDSIDGHAVRNRLRGEDLYAPEIVDLEVASVLRKLAARRSLSDNRCTQALGDLKDLRMQRVSHRGLVDRCWELRTNLTVYDAAYVALAELLQATLLTSDERMTNAAGAKCKFELIE